MFADRVQIAKHVFAKPDCTKYKILQPACSFTHSFSLFRRGNTQTELEVLQKGHSNVWHPHRPYHWSRISDSTEGWYSYCVYLDQILTGYRYSFPSMEYSMNADISDRLYLACFSYVKLRNPSLDSLLEDHSFQNKIIRTFFKNVCDAIVIRDKPTILYNIILAFKSRCENNHEIYSSTLMLQVFGKCFQILKSEFEAIIPYTCLIYAEDFQTFKSKTKTWQWILRQLKHKVGHDLAQLVMKKYVLYLAQDKINLQLKYIQNLID